MIIKGNKLDLILDNTIGFNMMAEKSEMPNRINLSNMIKCSLKILLYNFILLYAPQVYNGTKMYTHRTFYEQKSTCL